MQKVWRLMRMRRKIQRYDQEIEVDRKVEVIKSK